ncbi:hypothetical protein A9995_07045 [Erythrobacter sp. QSSC1-22B]|nr:hypothetical protein A9995_07045 [Erythrobacter sp. QSSC1-22B]
MKDLAWSNTVAALLTGRGENYDSTLLAPSMKSTTRYDIGSLISRHIKSQFDELVIVIDSFETEMNCIFFIRFREFRDLQRIFRCSAITSCERKTRSDFLAVEEHFFVGAQIGENDIILGFDIHFSVPFHPINQGQT